MLYELVKWKESMRSAWGDRHVYGTCVRACGLGACIHISAHLCSTFLKSTFKASTYGKNWITLSLLSKGEVRSWRVDDRRCLVSRLSALLQSFRPACKHFKDLY